MNLEIFLDDYCNLNCSYCSFKSKKCNKPIFNIDFTQFKTFEILGGETLFHPDLMDIIKQIPLESHIKIYTNCCFNKKSLENIEKLKVLDYDYEFICSYHKSQIDGITFLKNAKLLPHKTILIMVEDLNNYDYFLNLYKRWKLMFDNVFIDGLFFIKDNKMDLSYYDFINNKNDIEKTQILKQFNNNLNLSYYNIFKQIEKPKICKIKDYNRTLDCRTGKLYQCLQYMFDNDESFGYECNKTKCCCDLGYITKI